MPDRQPLLAVLIDADNVPASYAEAIFDEIASFGEASIRRIYGDFSREAMRSWSKKLAMLAIVPHQQFANTKGKNSSDIALVIDAMDILHSGRFEGFVLVSSDSDFTRLASRVREQGVEVYGMGERKTPEAFVKACKRFIYLENLTEPAQPKPRARSASPKEPAEAAERPAEAEDPTKLVIRAMDAINQDDEWYSLGQIGQYISAAAPDFDTRTYGQKKLSDLLGHLKLFELKKGQGNQWMVRRID